MNYTENSFIKPPTVTGIISNETYDWAIRTIEVPADLVAMIPYERLVEIAPITEHARWIIDRVHDGTLELKPVEVKP